jgi:hypothetical protein
MGGDHTAGVPPGLLLAVASVAGAAGGGGDVTVPANPPEVDFTVASVAGALFAACIAALPLGISLWALLDAARRPRWAWALAERRQVLWMALIMFGVLSVVGGLAISGWYLARVRPTVAAAEAGDI